MPELAVSVGARSALVIAVTVVTGDEYAYDPADPVRDRKLQV